MPNDEHAYHWTMPWNYDATIYHRCFAGGVHLRGDACRCSCADCAAWAAENRHRAAAERVPLSLARFTTVR